MPKGGNGLWKKNSSKRGGQRGHKIFDGRPLPISFLVSIVVFAIGHLVYSLSLFISNTSRTFFSPLVLVCNCMVDKTKMRKRRIEQVEAQLCALCVLYLRPSVSPFVRPSLRSSLRMSLHASLRLPIHPYVQDDEEEVGASVCFAG